MKKALIITGVVILILLTAYFSMYAFFTAPKDKGSFSVADYVEEIRNVDFQTDAAYGKISDYKIAAKTGRAIISHHFQNAASGVFNWMGCDVQYDSSGNAWHIRTYPLALNAMGGAYDVIITADGNVLAVWGEK